MKEKSACTFWAVHNEDGLVYSDQFDRAQIYVTRQSAREACTRLKGYGNRFCTVGRLPDDMDRLFVTRSKDA